MAARTKKTSTAKKTTQTVTPLVPVVKPTVTIAPVVKPAPAPVVTAKSVAAAERAKMIEIAAYVLAEKNGFRGDAQKYWLQAEKDVDAKLGKK